eukprot:CAMPEP_0195565352 /NCGR_PEP_ID=MMETSP0814-20130614/406_1 /TAXON_ID=97485 /ORGANISM="Prymnesium parvum, Strain Texoma1" /LENGTH=324 /DNA_ID=CAMNT_0040700345 /DNA_START=52 /DNA_END=1024 /DNA_ORIENTATION=-
MPTRVMTQHEMNESKMMVDLATLLLAAARGEDVEDRRLAELLILAAAEPFTRRLVQEIGHSHLSIRRLRSEAAESGMEEGDGTVGGHVFSGEEAVLLLLRRFRSTDPLCNLTKEAGRSVSAISEIVRYMVEHITSRFSHLIDERSLSGWASAFSAFSQAFRSQGVPIDHLIGFIDGKLWPVCRPGRYQQVMYSGHKRVHGVKMQSVVFPNGLLVYPFGPCNGSRHDSFLLRESEILNVMQECCEQLGQTYVLFGDSAYPISRYLWRMYKGVMTVQQQAFNTDMSSDRITIEWLYGIVVRLWPFLDYRKKLQVLLQPVTLFLNTG